MYVIIQAYYNFKRENMLNFKFLKLSSVFFILAFVLFSHNVSSAQEQTGETLTKIEIKEVKIEKSDMELKISGVLFNPSKNVVTSEITHLLILKTIDPLIKPKSEIDLLPSLIVAADEGKDYFSLKPNEQKIFSYFLPISPYIPQASYDLYLGFIRSNGQIEVRYENTVKNLGSQQKDGFLAFDQESCVLLDKEGKKFGNNDGPVFLPEESPEARCLVKNIGDKEIEVSPKILWKEVYVYGKPLDGTIAVENPDQKIFFKPGETKLVSLSMPKAEKPQTYQGLITFEDKEGMSRSFNMFFRWTIAGESARIKSVTQTSQLKGSYSKGEKINLSVDYFGSADLFWTGTEQNVSNLSNLIMKAVIEDGDGNVCGEKEEALADITDGEIKNKVIEVILDKRCKDMSYSVFLDSGQKSLAEESGELPKVVKEQTIPSYLYFGIPVLLVILIAFSFFRKKKIVPVNLLIILFAGVTMFSGEALAATRTYPDFGGATSTYRWGGDWTLDNGTEKLKSNPAGGGGMNILQVFSAEAQFSGYFDSSGDLNDVYIDYRAVDNSCANTGMRVQFEMFIKADGLNEQKVSFAKSSSSDWKNKIRLWYNNASGDIIERRFNVKPSDLSSFYNEDKTAKKNPKLVIYMKQAGYNSHEDKYSEGYFSVANNKLRTENDAFNMGDTVKIEIPLKIPDPSVSLSAPAVVTSPNSANVVLITTDLSDRTYSNAHPGTTGTNGFDSLSFDATPNSGTKSQTKTVSNVWITTSSNADQKNVLTITYTRDLGQYIGKGTYTANSTVTVKPASSSSISSSSSSCSLTINKDTTGGNGSVNVVRSAGNSFVCNLQRGYSSCNSNNESLGDKLTLQPSPSGTWPTPTGCSSVSNGICTVNLPSSTPCSKSVTVKFPVIPDTPSNLSANSACRAVNLTWDIDKNGGEYNDPVGNTGSKVVNYYEITRGGSYTIKKSDNINRWDYTNKKFVDDNNSYTDSTATDSTKTYSYKIKACNDQSQCSAEVGPSEATPSAGPCTTTTTTTVTPYCGDNSCNNNETCSTCSNDCGSCVYNPDYYNLTLNKTGSGNVKLYAWKDSSNGYNETVDNDFANNESNSIKQDWWFKMTATPDSGSYFSSWSGCTSTSEGKSWTDADGVAHYSTPSSDENACYVTMSGDKTVTVTFNNSSGPTGPGGGSSVKAYISARDTVVTDGNSTLISWTSDNATSCEQKEGGSDTGWASASDTVSGSYTTDNFTTSGGARTYTVNCANGSQTAEASVTVDVGSDYTGSPSVNMWADPQSVGYKKTSKIQWLGSNVSGSCLLYSASDNMTGYLTYYNFPSSQYFGPGYYAQVGSNNATGQTTGKLSSDTVYKIQCAGYQSSGYAKTRAQTTVTVAKPVSNFTIANSGNKSLVANIVEGLSANSGNIALTLNGEAIGNVSLSAGIPAISGAKAQFSSDGGVTWSDTLSVDISAISQVKIKVIKISGATAAGTYNTAVTATDTGSGGKTKKLNVNLQVNRVSSEWEEF